MTDALIHPSASQPDPVTGAVLRRAHLRDIDPRTVYLLARLRQDVFTLEQGATDADLDGRELEPGTTLLWIEVPAPNQEQDLDKERDSDPEQDSAKKRDPDQEQHSAQEQSPAQEVPLPVAHIRVLTEADQTMRIGRLVVAAQHRRDGYGGRIMRAALDVTAELAPEQDVHIDAQAYLERWYQGMGYETVGEMFLEAGIEHVPMRYRHPRR